MNRITRLTAIILSLLLLVACGATAPEPSSEPAPPTAPVSGPADTPSPTEAPTPAEEPTADDVDGPFYKFFIDRALEADDFDDSITFEDLFDMIKLASTDSVTIAHVAFTGKVLQVMGGDGFTAYRFAVDSDYDKIIYVESYPEYPVDPLAEDDYATLYGVTYGEYTYETILGEMITLPAVLAARFEKEEIPIPEYPTGPVTITNYNSTMEIESFAIVDSDIAYNGDLYLTCEITGKVSGSQYLSFHLKCYDKDDILIDRASVFETVSDGEKFRITTKTFVPADTIRVEFVTD